MRELGLWYLGGPEEWFEAMWQMPMGKILLGA